MRVILLLLSLYGCIGSYAQESLPAATATTAPDSLRHENAVKLVESTGARQRLIDSRDSIMQQGKDAMLKSSPELAPEFAEEWVMRMRKRFSPDPYIGVIVAVYEKHFDAVELADLTRAQAEMNAGKTPTFPDALRSKIQATAVEVQSEILGGCAQVGAKIGGEVGQEIATEHPEWLKQPKAANVK
jgi:hypothetical protein